MTHILRFPDLNSANQANTLIESRSVQAFVGGGYLYDSSEHRVLLARNNEEIYSSKQYVDSWDTPKTHPEGGYYILSPRNKYPTLHSFLTQDILGMQEDTLDYENIQLDNAEEIL